LRGGRGLGHELVGQQSAHEPWFVQCSVR
jgi:hypothetical protein